jgi:lipoprotein-anchoring transpeptidase ErfK/SrfK
MTAPARLLPLLVLLLACGREAPPPVTDRPATPDAAPPAAPAPAEAPMPAYAPLPIEQTDTLKPGEFRWAAERVDEGPVLIVVSLPEQMAYVYRNGVEIARSTVSTGRKGHRTPTGVFQILQKQKRHYSSIYNSAPMPYMERLTWDGIALHAGNLPGYPASHGCIRLPLEFSKLLYGVTSMGGTVVIADEAHGGANLAHPGFLAPRLAAGTEDPVPSAAWWFEPERSDSGPVAIVVSSASREVHVLRNGVEIGRAPIELVGDAPLVPATYVRTDRVTDAPHPFVPGQPFHIWTMIGEKGVDSTAAHQVSRRVRVPTEFAAGVYGVLRTGTVVVVTDEPLEPARRSDPAFTIASSEPVEEAPVSAN